MEGRDIRWHQRFSNFQKALAQLNKAVDYFNHNELNDLEKQGIIQAFEFTHELAWNVIKDYFFYQGNTEIRGSRDAVREAYKFGLIASDSGESWMKMIISRNKTSHTYDENTANEIVENITGDYISEFNAFNIKMQQLRDAE